MRKNIFIKILLPTALVFLLLGAVSPTLAHTSIQTYNFISVGYSKVPGEETVVDNVLYVKGSVGIGDNYGYPWGEATHTQRNYFYLNQTDYTGKLIGYIDKDFCRGDLRMIGRCEFVGVGVYIYNGPTITANGTDANGNIIPVEITDGTQFFGLLFTGGASGYATINHNHFEVKEKMSGVNIVGGPLNGVGLIVGTGTYSMLRHHC